jgi:hypothetical protein
MLPGPDAYAARAAETSRRPEDVGNAIEPFLASGGATAFIVQPGGEGGPAFDPRPAGAQLVCSQYIPAGKAGWIKQLRCAPYCPPELSNPWQGWPATWQTFQTVGNVDGNRAPAQGGVYTTPMGWESYFDAGTTQLAQWHWWLATLPGTLAKAREGAHVGAFTLADPSTWWLLEGGAVPASVYDGGYPGSALEGSLPRQRMQVLQGDALDWHVAIPEDTTVMLWASWTQSDVAPRATDASGVPSVVGPRIYPLLPSFGQLCGYMQRANDPRSLDNARNGW